MNIKNKTAGSSMFSYIEKPVFEKRDKNAHKGSFGTALSVCGSYGMAGAAILSSKAALRSGVGIMKTACIKENYSSINIALPETVTIPLESLDGKYDRSGLPILKEHLKKASALLIGCGLGVSNDTAFITRELALSSPVPVVIDADGINAVASDIEFIKQMKADLVLTPHPAEMSRLCGLSVVEIDADRTGVARHFAKKWGAVVVLKGRNTVVASPNGSCFVNQTGNVGLATGGSGDVLSGIIVSLLAQGIEPVRATTSAVWLHGAAADKAAKIYGEVSLLPSDVIEQLPNLF